MNNQDFSYGYASKIKTCYNKKNRKGVYGNGKTLDLNVEVKNTYNFIFARNVAPNISSTSRDGE